MVSRIAFLPAERCGYKTAVFNDSLAYGTSVTESNLRRGALYIVSAAAVFASMSAVLKAVQTTLPDTMIVFLRNFFSLLFMLPWLVRIGVRGLRTDAFRLHLQRALVGLGGMYCFIYAIGALNLAEAVLLNHTATLFIPFLAWWWLGERVPLTIAAAISVGFTGVIFILKPGSGIVSTGALIGLASGFFSAVAMVTIRRNARTEPYTRIVFYFFVLGTLLSAIPLFWTWQTPSWREFTVMAIAGGLATGGQLLITRGYASAPAAQIGPFTYSTVLFAALFGWAFWNEAPDGWSLLGAALIIAGGALAMYFSARAPAASPSITTDR